MEKGIASPKSIYPAVVVLYFFFNVSNVTRITDFFVLKRYVFHKDCTEADADLYALSEEMSGIGIETRSCDTGVGSSFCEEWAIDVSSETEPGCYFVFILPLGETTPIIPSGFQIDVSTASAVDTTPPEWTSAEVLVTANTDPGMLYVEWGTAVDADSPPVTYLVGR